SSGPDRVADAFLSHLCVRVSFRVLPSPSFFFSTDTAPPDIYTLSLHDALPILPMLPQHSLPHRLYQILRFLPAVIQEAKIAVFGDRKSTRLNSSHVSISYAVFCLKKKKKYRDTNATNNNNTRTETTDTRLPTTM